MSDKIYKYFLILILVIIFKYKPNSCQPKHKVSDTDSQLIQRGSDTKVEDKNEYHLTKLDERYYERVGDSQKVRKKREIKTSDDETHKNTKKRGYKKGVKVRHLLPDVLPEDKETESDESNESNEEKSYNFKSCHKKCLFEMTSKRYRKCINKCEGEETEETTTTEVKNLSEEEEQKSKHKSKDKSKDDSEDEDEEDDRTNPKKGGKKGDSQKVKKRNKSDDMSDEERDKETKKRGLKPGVKGRHLLPDKLPEEETESETTTKSKPTEEESDETMTTTETTSKNTIKQPDHCGYRSLKDKEKGNKLIGGGGMARIVGGSDADPHEFPWITSLQYYKSTERVDSQHFCGGAIITKNYIITAAHCMDRFVGKEKSIKIKIGVNNPKLKSVQEIHAVKVIVHEEWDVKRQLNDIALIKVKPDIQFNTNKEGVYIVNALCLPHNSTEPEGEAVIAGWGELVYQKGVPADYLQKVDVPLVSRKECGQVYDFYLKKVAKNTDIKVKNLHICAGGKGGEDACRGDSGGSLIQSHHRQFFSYGLVSFSVPCAIKDLPTIYTNVIRYMNWIHENVN